MTKPISEKTGDLLKEWHEFASQECCILSTYKRGGYDRKMYDWWIKKLATQKKLDKEELVGKVRELFKRYNSPRSWVTEDQVLSLLEKNI